jgi:ATP-dependent Clp protease ATP-binding subunit ClpC
MRDSVRKRRWASTDPSITCIIAPVMQHATETLTKIFANAQQEARRLNQDFVGTEHLAMALLDLDDSEAGRILAQMNVESGYVRNQLQHMLPSGKEPPVVSGNLPMSPKSQRLVTNAIVTAQAAGQGKVSTRFLLAALLAEASGIVCETFRRSGADAPELAKALRERSVTAEA